MLPLYLSKTICLILSVILFCYVIFHANTFLSPPMSGLQLQFNNENSVRDYLVKSSLVLYVLQPPLIHANTSRINYRSNVSHARKYRETNHGILQTLMI